MQIIRDLERVTGTSNMCASTKIKLSELTPKIYEQASLEASSSSRLRCVLKDLDTSGR